MEIQNCGLIFSNLTQVLYKILRLGLFLTSALLKQQGPYAVFFKANIAHPMGVLKNTSTTLEYRFK